MRIRRQLGWGILKALGGAALAVCFLAGCAGPGGLARSETSSFTPSTYYLKSDSELWAKDSRKSAVTGTVSANAMVTELKRNKYGWSLVQSADGSVKGWLPTALLRKKPVVKQQPAPAGVEAQPAALEARPPAGQSAPAPKQKSESWFSPPSAEAATPPPAPPKPGPSEGKETDPSFFDRF